MDISNKVIVVTGAFGQLGAAVSEEVKRLGGKVALLDLLDKKSPDSDPSWSVDLTSYPQARDTMEAIFKNYGVIDGLVNVAGGFTWQTLEKSAALAEWEQMFAMNVSTCVHASKAVLPYLLRRGGGRIVNISAAGSAKAAAGMGAYAASKSGVARFTEALACELKDKKITVNAVLPGVIDTPRNREDMPGGDFSAWVSLEDIARVIGFLLSDAASGITGALVPVTGRS